VPKMELQFIVPLKTSIRNEAWRCRHLEWRIIVIIILIICCFFFVGLNNPMYELDASNHPYLPIFLQTSRTL
jgi:hypothetical protein